MVMPKMPRIPDHVLQPRLALPAALAAAAYANARYGIFYDVLLLSSVVPTVTDVYWRSCRGRLSPIYRLQSLATTPSSARRIFLRFQDKTWTYAETYDNVLRYANWLRQQRGIKVGDVVALDFQNTENLVFLIFAVWALGAKPALINFNLKGKPLQHCVDLASARLLIVDPEVAEAVDADLRSKLVGAHVDIFTAELELEARKEEPVSSAKFPGETPLGDMAVLIYTSGTTGLPKAAVISWAKLSIVGGFTSRWIGTRPTDVFFTAMPLYHATALIMGLSHVLSAGASLAFSRKFSTSQFWPDVRRHNATIIQYVGEACRYLLHNPPSIDPVTGEDLDKKHSVRIAFGNGLRPDIWNRFKERFNIETIAEFYALTEGSFGTWNLSRNDFTMGAVGRNGSLYNLILGSDAAFVKVDYNKDEPFRDSKTGFCQRVKPGQSGELLWKLPHLDVESRFQGYYGDKESTSKKVLRSVFVKGDAWLRTGDVLRIDDENRTFFTDRIGDTYRWKSENVATAEVSTILGCNHSVREVNVYGVQVPHHEGRAGCAAIKFHDFAERGNGEPRPDVLSDLAAHASKGLPKYAVPQFLRVLKGPGLEMTGTNKHPKNLLRNQGIDPEKVSPDLLYRLDGQTYVPFDPEAWTALQKGLIRL